MKGLNNPAKILARRFVSLPTSVRVEIAGRLLRLCDENQSTEDVEGPALFRAKRDQSFLAQFWDEVERAHGDNLYPANPFDESRARIAPRKHYPERRLACL
ncbi:MAG TPA: hypothetical protein VF791_07185 [Pyrinomonadaceae bacterium]